MIETAADSLADTLIDRLDLLEPDCIAAQEQTDWVIAMSIGIDADVHRIFHALTVPEFIEAWIEIPGHTQDSCVAASQLENGYRLSHVFADRTAMSITGSYLFCHRRKMRLLWRKASGSSQTESIVDFRLRGNFGSSILQLRHLQLGSVEEFFWHRQLWRSSLEKLSFLLRA